MSRHTTFRVGGPAELFVKPETEEEVSALLSYLYLTERDYYILGNGSNLLVSDQGYQGIVVQIYQNMSQINENGTEIVCQSGALLSTIAARAQKLGLSGMEFASGIPGTIGGAVVMNAGAYGGEMKQIVKSVRVVAANGTIMAMSADEMEFGYRKSIFKKEPLVCTEVTIGLQQDNSDNIRTKMDDFRNRRIEKQPLEYPSAGSIFKRPEGYFAGKLIMDAGLSGMSIGGAKVSEKHCGFIINTGNATASDVKDLIDEVREKVKERFGVTLEPEVCMLGDFGQRDELQFV